MSLKQTWFRLLLLTASLWSSGASAADGFEPITANEIREGARLLRLYCLTCHGVDDKREDQLLAPPLWGVREHYIRVHKTPEAFVTAMVDFMNEPSREKSLMPCSLDRYGLMQAMPLTDEQLRATAVAIFAGQIQRPTWWKRYEKAHKSCFK
ncbi:c-type cytochrome [Coraliomargarita akajimensis]|uniref:Cytochrome c domain-containing protein n=1 Tax=Coraliomargarita akajimensis (strain DSM 45221 / IAM 15411 / JCM 23193 / KCTC 12865 / 04OKA010-24) TaxID=583355 RepID=D5EIS3_CORAD|nr:hypothetical protein [Coraliomargarita akajimensis]ADE54322.1 hypothetical protein Caka_1302 [Coraliomargarita akajimensis DSM 45221]